MTHCHSWERLESHRGVRFGSSRSTPRKKGKVKTSKKAANEVRLRPDLISEYNKKKFADTAASADNLMRARIMADMLRSQEDRDRARDSKAGCRGFTPTKKGKPAKTSKQAASEPVNDRTRMRIKDEILSSQIDRDRARNGDGEDDSAFDKARLLAEEDDCFDEMKADEPDDEADDDVNGGTARHGRGVRSGKVSKRRVTSKRR
jgi:hypothetical protein